MFETDRLIYLQMQKTGCSHVADLLDRCYGGEQTNKHAPLGQQLPTGKYVAGSVRNPWSWYLSLWSFGCQRGGSMHGRLVRRGDVGQRDSWRALYANARSVRRFRAWVTRILDPATAPQLGEGYADSPIVDFAGLMTWRYCRLHVARMRSPQARTRIRSVGELRRFIRRNEVLDGVIRTEHLEEDLLVALRAAGHEVTPEIEQVIRAGRRRPLNRTRHRRTEAYYDDATRALVADRERYLVQRFGYEPPPRRATVMELVVRKPVAHLSPRRRPIDRAPSGA